MKKQQLTANHWGAGVSHIEDGQLKNVEPYSGDPDPSRINENISSSLKGSARVLRPSVRKSYLENGPTNNNGKRGEEQFVEVSWDKAFELIADELSRVKADYGNKAIYGGSYGWASAGRMHHAQSQLKRFLNCTGGFVKSVGNYSYNAALVLMPHIVGDFREHVKHITRWSTVAKEGELVVMFGGIPLRNTQVSGGGVGKHRLRGDFQKCVDANVKFVNLSPLKTDAIEALNAEWLAPRPGSDTAIMMGLAHTLFVEGLHDQAFLDKYTVGFDKFRAYLLGETDEIVKDADWAAKQSEIPADRIRSLAREMASKRTLITTAVSLQRADFGEQPLWMTVTLASMLGQIGLPGGGYGIGYGADSTIGTSDRPFRWSVFPQGKNPIEDYLPVAMISEMLLKPNQPYEYNGETRTFPDIKLVWWAGGNPFHHHQDLNRLRDAFQKPQTIIVNEINWTATAKHADIVLPIASTLERNDFGAGHQDNSLVPMPKAMEPIGEAREEYEIYCELAKRLGVGQEFSEGMNSSERLASMWSELQEIAKPNGYDLPELSDFQKGDMISFEDPAPETVYLSGFINDPDANALKTPSGKIELFSETIAGFEYEECPGHATWLPPREWLGCDETENFPLHLISGQPETRLHSQYDNGKFSMEKKIKGREPILINPVEAEKRGIKDGDIVRLKNGRGQSLAGAVVTDDIRQGVVFLWTGAWYDPDFSHPENLDTHGNPNVLTHDFRTSRLGQGPAAQSALVEVEKFKGQPPQIRAFDAPL